IVPDPEIVPALAALLITTVEPGLNVALAPTLIVPLTLKFVLAETVAAVFEIVKLLNVVVEEPLTACAAVPLSTTFNTSLESALTDVKVPLFVKSPPTFNVWMRFPGPFAACIVPPFVTAPVTVNESLAPELKLSVPVPAVVRLRIVALARSYVIVCPVSMLMSSTEVGTCPQDQRPVLFQLPPPVELQAAAY